MSVLSHWALLISLALFHLVGPVPPELGLHGGALASCPAWGVGAAGVTRWG